MKSLWLTGLLVGIISTPASFAFSGAQTQKPAPPKKAGASRTVEITGSDDMKFSLNEITAKPGEQLHIVLKSVGKMPKAVMAHNVVVLKLAADPAAFANAAMLARETDYIPPDMKAQVLAATKLAGPGETVEVTLKVPAKPGSYPFMCTFPGHFAAGMRGQLIVK
jgi:azurin